MRFPSGDDVDGGDEFWGDVVRDKVRQAFLFLQDVGNALDSPRAVLNTDKKGASGGIGERDDRLERALGRSEITLELQRFAFRPAEEGDQIHSSEFYSDAAAGLSLLS